MATQEEQLVDLLVKADEAVVVNAIESAAKKRIANGLGKDIIEALGQRGIKVRTLPTEKPFLKSK